MSHDRREFLNHVGSGMLVAGLGATLASDLGISTAFADETDDSLSFGEYQPLVELMQETPAHQLQPMLVKKLQSGDTDLQQLVGAAALANAVTFGGQDYVGYHTEMALLPALEMARELPAERQPLPVLKVIYRNAQRIQATGAKKTLAPVLPADPPAGEKGAELLRQAIRAGDMKRSEQIFAWQVDRSVKEAFNNVLWAVQDNSNVHRFALAHRAWGLIGVVGQQHAHTMLRQCVRYCVDREQFFHRKGYAESPIRRLIPKLLDQYQLLGGKTGTREPEDAWLDEMSRFIYQHSGEEAMDAVAAALADGMSHEAVGEAISLAANQLVLRQDQQGQNSWRAHGATPGVHASDANNAWRNMVREANRRNSVVGLLVAAYHTGGSKCFTDFESYPLAVHVEAIDTTDSKTLLQIVEAAIQENDQGRASAAIQIYGEQGYPARPVFDLMLRYGVSEDGRLHAEKYYRTVTEEFASSRPAFRWRHLVALARVTASSYGYNAQDEAGHRAPGYEDACRLLGVHA